MKSKFLLMVACILLVGQVDAQSFLKDLGKSLKNEIKREVQKGVEKKVNESVDNLKESVRGRISSKGVSENNQDASQVGSAISQIAATVVARIRYGTFLSLQMMWKCNRWLGLTTHIWFAASEMCLVR